ncbi:sensor histidine kinase [Aurantivibrio plasticivorans]
MTTVTPISSATINEPETFDEESYKLLRVYAYYRTLLSSILLLLFISQITKNYLGVQASVLFLTTVILYTTTNLFILIYLWVKHFTPRTSQIIGILVIDICALAVLMYASDGNELAYLIVVCIAAGSIFLDNKVSLGLAGFAALVVLTESVVQAESATQLTKNLIFSGTFTVLVLATAHAFNILSNKIRASTLEAKTQAQQAEYLEQLSQLIIERMRTGILVVNKEDEIMLSNHAAKELLELAPDSFNIASISTLKDHLDVWRAYPHTRSPTLAIGSDARSDIRISFAKLDTSHQSDTLIFAEDNRRLSQQAQQLKLASLGRLTASIAHEVRNPLGAISHAAQLLSESKELSTPDQRLSDIIQNHSKRVNGIIENIMQLSRRKHSSPERVNLNEWLQAFVDEYLQSKAGHLSLSLERANIETRVDISQLHQVLSNLCDNGLRYSEMHTGKPEVSLRAGIDSHSELPYIEVIDSGKGIDESDVEQIFEPFFTTESSGSGLGLYICRELCETNQATLEYRRTQDGKSCFVITLAHPDRVF